MRPIDADALTRELKSIKTTFGSGKGLVEGGLEIAISTTNAMPTISEWIPCSERLPLHGSRVLVTATHKKLGHTAVDVLRYHGDEYGWENSDFYIVNAWMPLPAPWEEGEPNG